MSHRKNPIPTPVSPLVTPPESSMTTVVNNP